MPLLVCAPGHPPRPTYGLFSVAGITTGHPNGIMGRVTVVNENGDSVASDQINGLPVPGPSPEAEAERRADLRKHKAIATGLLVLATLIYVLMRWMEYQGNPGRWIGYVRAASEAGMVGALADWFAVTALFRHPLGIPIPHTAIIKRKKDQVGHQLSEFVGENFFNSAAITEQLRKAKIPKLISDQLLAGNNAERASEQICHVVDRAVNDIDPAMAEHVLRAVVVDKLNEPMWAPPLGRGLEQLIEEGRTEPIVDAVVVWMDDRAHNSEDFVVRLIDERTPTWAPRFIRDLVGSKVYTELVGFTHDVRHNPDHDARRELRKFIATLAKDLQHDPKMIERIEKFKSEVMTSGPVQALPGMLWEGARVTLTDMARDEHSVLRVKIAEWLREAADKLRSDPEWAARLEDGIVRVASYVAENHVDKVTGVIGETVERWDAEEASDRIELMVGKDLQFIRVNGTVVGALAGLAIYTLTELIFAVS